MTSSLFNTAKYVQFGASAARAGKKTEAREFLKLALQQSPEYLPALFWMAFVAETPQESIIYLGRVLAIDPDNERARAGLRWVEQQSVQIEASSSADPAATDSPASPTMAGEKNRVA